MTTNVFQISPVALAAASRLATLLEDTPESLFCYNAHSLLKSVSAPSSSGLPAKI